MTTRKKKSAFIYGAFSDARSIFILSAIRNTIEDTRSFVFSNYV